MLRTLAGIGIGLALVGSAHAQDQATINVTGKSPRAVRAEIYRTAKDLCARQQTDMFQTESCVQDSYSDALQQFQAMRVQRVAYQVPTASRVR